MTSQPIQPHLRLAQAYGVAAPRSGVPARAAGVRDSVEISGAVSQDQLPTLAQRAKTPKTAALVAARVPGVSLDVAAGSGAGTAPTSAGSLALYTNPALKNAAATGVTLGAAVGSSLDVQA
ncbi:MAG: hypothetical protein GC200_05275 [Tepidisphaera sp.]|nr:hypothetical protein [Tepidisphaera sp.]